MSGSAFHVARTADGIRVWFAVENADGSLRTGLGAGNFTATVIRDDDGASTNPAVSESTQLSGVYFFDILAAFLTTSGNNYFAIVQVTLAPLSNVAGPIFASTRLWDDLAQPGDAMDLVTDAVDADAVATSGANEIRDAILSDSTAFNGADVAAILIDTGTDIPARFDGVEGAGFVTGTDSLEAIRNRGDAAWITATGFSTHSAADVDTVLTAAHGSGSWTSASSTDWTSGEREQIRSALGVDGTKTAAISGQLQDMQGAGFLTATDSLEAIRNRGDTAWTTAVTVNLSSAAIDAIWDEIFTGHTTPDSFGVLVRDMWRRLNLDDSEDVVHTDVTDSTAGSIVVGSPAVIDITLTKVGAVVTSNRTT